jgi:hypothetical protein
MDKPSWELLNRIVFDIAKTLQDGKHSTAEEWGEIASELERASMLANDEANRLAELEDN